ncbi:MAG: EAL domain-containing protein, partial [Candidatus Spyradocola sp.]
RPQVILHRVASLIKLRENAAMINQFQYDRLTGLYSKEFFYQKVRERLAEEPDKDYCIVCTNIENFKLFNDTFGTREGDRLLQEVARIAQQMMGETGFCGRLSADHFLCLQEKGREEADRLKFGSFDAPPSPMLRSVVMRWGIYEITDRSVPVEQMCDRALLAASSIKGKYNEFFAVYDDVLRRRLLREKAITDAMEQALEEKQFTVYLQPKYSLTESRMAGAEALVRWIHPEWGFMSPGEFVPLFEKNGFIHRMDAYVWEQACALLRDWKRKGLPLMPISVNVSRADVYHTDLVQALGHLTKRYGVEPEYLHLEITESAYADNPGQIISTVSDLRSHGFLVEMDDFGSGYSSLNMLGQMKLDILKLDMKFVQNEIAKPVEQSILNDIVSMAHRRHLSVVAEGVETREQADRLMRLGCDQAQGYFFAKPMPAGQFEELLQRQPADGVLPERRRRAGAKACLLVVDEDAGYRSIVNAQFAEQFRVLEAGDADTALGFIADEENSVAAVVLSMTLPGDAAARVLHTVRQNPACWNTPVLAVIPSGDQMEQYPQALEADDFLCRCHPLFDLRKRIQLMTDLVALRQRESVLRDAANRDHLTGLLNRRGLQAALAALRKEELPLAVCMFDMDTLKTVNDSGGHDAGDRLLTKFAELLCRYTRTGDIQCRYGGDEFLIVLKRLGDEQVIIKKCRQIMREFRERLAEEDIPASCSVGIALCGVDDEPCSALVRRADEALYQAKRENKGGCCVWRPQEKR